jgi:hypothetical protein
MFERFFRRRNLIVGPTRERCSVEFSIPDEVAEAFSQLDAARKRFRSSGIELVPPALARDPRITEAPPQGNVLRLRLRHPTSSGSSGS